MSYLKNILSDVVVSTAMNSVVPYADLTQSELADKLSTVELELADAKLENGSVELEFALNGFDALLGSIARLNAVVEAEQFDNEAAMNCLQETGALWQQLTGTNDIVTTAMCSADLNVTKENTNEANNINKSRMETYVAKLKEMFARLLEMFSNLLKRIFDKATRVKADLVSLEKMADDIKDESINSELKVKGGLGKHGLSSTVGNLGDAVVRSTAHFEMSHEEGALEEDKFTFLACGRSAEIVDSDLKLSTDKEDDFDKEHDLKVLSKSDIKSMIGKLKTIIDKLSGAKATLSQLKSDAAKLESDKELTSEKVASIQHKVKAVVGFRQFLLVGIMMDTQEVMRVLKEMVKEHHAQPEEK